MIKLDVNAWFFITKNSVITMPRFETLIRFSKETENISGSVAEVGAYLGGSSFLLATCNQTKPIFIFDTFEGLPDPTVGIDLHHKGDFPADYNYVKGLLSGFRNVKIYKGLFPKENSDIIANEKFSLVHIDVDLYKSVLECSQFFYHRMTPGGILAYDDYNHPSCVGAKKALDEFMIDKSEKIEVGAECQVYVKKE
jgi:hypothetical protein